MNQANSPQPGAYQYRTAHAAGQDAGNRSMKDRGLTQWDEIAWDVAAETFEKVAGAL